eukprot:5739898-Pyramimonas_sp.AAC.1
MNTLVGWFHHFTSPESGFRAAGMGTMPPGAQPESSGATAAPAGPSTPAAARRSTASSMVTGTATPSGFGSIHNASSGAENAHQERESGDPVRREGLCSSTASSEHADAAEIRRSDFANGAHVHPGGPLPNQDGAAAVDHRGLDIIADRER